MDTIDFYSEKKWCEKCQEYVRFLMSVDHSFCITCGTRVRLFSQKDWEAFHAAAEASRPSRKGRRVKAS